MTGHAAAWAGQACIRDGVMGPGAATVALPATRSTPVIDLARHPFRDAHAHVV